MKKKTAYLGMLSAAAILLGYIESLFPLFAGVPGMKVGLANLAVVMLLYLYSWREALAVSLVRILVIGFLFGNLFSVLFSLAGALFSLLGMLFAKKILKLSCIGVSLVGGVMHNAGQILAAMAVVENVRVGYYFSVLAVTGMVTGILIGLVSADMVRRMAPILKNLEMEELLSK